MPCCARSESGPVLFVGDVPELNSILLIESRLADFVRMEVPFADDVGLVHRFRPHGEHQHVVRMQVEKEVGQQGK